MKKKRPKKRRVSQKVTLRYAEIVADAEKIYRLRSARVPIPELSRIAQASERTIRNAFLEMHGAAPARFHRSLRLAKVRDRFLTTKRKITVAEVAKKHGFTELGRFSVKYREVYGENPSATLRRRDKLRRRNF